MKTMRRLFALGAALALLAAGCGSDRASTTTTATAGPGDEAAAHALVRVQAELRRGNFATAWQSLHPAERKVVSVQRLAACYPRTEFPRTVTFRATRIEDVVWQVPGTSTISEAKAVTITAASGGRKVATFKQHAVRAGGRWTWMLSSAYFKKARNGTC
jgi:hypothetical protein